MSKLMCSHDPVPVIFTFYSYSSNTLLNFIIIHFKDCWYIAFILGFHFFGGLEFPLFYVDLIFFKFYFYSFMLHHFFYYPLNYSLSFFSIYRERNKRTRNYNTEPLLKAILLVLAAKMQSKRNQYKICNNCHYDQNNICIVK